MKPEIEELQSPKMTLMQHFAELRRRIIWVILIFSCLFCVGWILTPQLQEFLTKPLINVWPGGKMLYTGLTDGLNIQLQLSTLFAVAGTIPAILWHTWAFISTGLRKKEKMFIAPILILSPVLFVAGAAFAFYILFPVAFKVFIEMNQSSMIPATFLPSATEYLSLTISLLKIFGVAFQLPLVLVLLNRLGILSRSLAVKSRRYTIVLIFVASAILTPTTDMVSQCMMAVPLMALFELSILFMKKP